jgi:glycosyltransferase involved in cell wall biosynthesis
MSREAAIVIDWNTSGHHPMYLREYALAFAGKGLPVLVLSPEPPALDPLPPCVIWRGIPTVGWMKKRQFFGMPFARWLFARHVSSIIREAQTTEDIHCKKVFFGCFHENQSKLSSRLISTMGIPAAGLYVQAVMFHSGKHLKDCKVRHKVEALLKHPLLDTVFMLDEAMMETIGAYCGKKVVFLPDISDCTAISDDPLPGKLGLVPKTRPVLGLLGHLRPSKGVAEMIAFARSVPELDATFLLAGSCNWKEFPPAEEEAIKRAVAEDPRIVFHPERIPEESSYNALVRACDVLWAVYRDSPHSSNTLAKAAYFKRPVVVADGYLMARRTRRYALGAVVPENDAAAMREVLLPMLADPAGWLAAHPPRWDEFHKDNSNARFRETLREWARPELQQHGAP